MQSNLNNWKVCIAPMLCWTDIHFRYLIRMLSFNVRLYTEMVTTDSIIYGDSHKFLKFNSIENPVAFQIGGSNPKDLAKCSLMIQDYGYNEINLNCGCPSPKVQNARIGASLMKDVSLVSDCLNAMQEKANVPVTIKHRLGIGYDYSYSQLRDFVGTLDLKTNCNTFIIHARSAILGKLSPRQNRQIPVLKYDYVYQLKKDFPHLNIILNGGIKSVNDISHHLNKVDGVMIGREAYKNPLLVSNWDNLFFKIDNNKQINNLDLVYMLYEYAKKVLINDKNIFIKDIVRHYLGIFHGFRGVRYWRRTLSDFNYLKENDASIIIKAWEAMNNNSI